MAQKILTEVLDDMEPDRELPADCPGTQFSFDGIEYEIDLTQSNKERLRDNLWPFIQCARRVTRNSSGKGKGSGPKRIRDGVNPDIRAWAKEQGISISDRGRIPTAIIERYEARSAAPPAPPVAPVPHVPQASARTPGRATGGSRTVAASRRGTPPSTKFRSGTAR